MGGAFVAVADDSNTLYWNPAGIASLGQGEGTFMHAKKFSLNVGPQLEVDYGAIASRNYDWGALGFSWMKEGNDEILAEETLSLTYGKRITDSLKLGFNIKSLKMTPSGSQTIKDDPAIVKQSSSGFDLGVLYNVNEVFRLGFVGRNLGVSLGEVAERDLDAQYRFGMAYFPADQWTIAMDISRRRDIHETKGYTNILSGGFEYVINKFLALRAGVNNNNLTMGLGFLNPQWQLDYAFWNSELGDTHRVSATMKFGDVAEKPSVEKDKSKSLLSEEVVSPATEQSAIEQSAIEQPTTDQPSITDEGDKTSVAPAKPQAVDPARAALLKAVRMDLTEWLADGNAMEKEADLVKSISPDASCSVIPSVSSGDEFREADASVNADSDSITIADTEINTDTEIIAAVETVTDTEASTDAEEVADDDAAATLERIRKALARFKSSGKIGTSGGLSGRADSLNAANQAQIEPSFSEKPSPSVEPLTLSVSPAVVASAASVVPEKVTLIAPKAEAAASEEKTVKDTVKPRRSGGWFSRPLDWFKGLISGKSSRRETDRKTGADSSVEKITESASSETVQDVKAGKSAVVNPARERLLKKIAALREAMEIRNHSREESGNEPGKENEDEAEKVEKTKSAVPVTDSSGALVDRIVEKALSENPEMARNTDSDRPVNPETVSDVKLEEIVDNELAMARKDVSTSNEVQIESGHESLIDILESDPSKIAAEVERLIDMELAAANRVNQEKSSQSVKSDKSLNTVKTAKTVNTVKIAKTVKTVKIANTAKILKSVKAVSGAAPVGDAAPADSSDAVIADEVAKASSSPVQPSGKAPSESRPADSETVILDPVMRKKKVDALLRQANSSLLGNSVAEAARLYQEIIAIDPRCATAYYKLALIYRTMDDMVQARRNFDMGFELDPSSIYSKYSTLIR
jgi:tetratricopeptide (TPR) repeat protein